MKTRKPGEWIRGRGWHQEKWDAPPSPAVEGFPTHEALSRVSPANPVFLTHASGHASFVNAKALGDRAAAGLGIRSLTKPTRTVATRLAADALRSNAPDVAERAVRQLLALSPEVQTC